MTTSKTYPLGSTILAAARDGTMSDDEVRHTITALTQHLHAKAAEDTKKKQHIARMQDMFCSILSFSPSSRVLMAS